MHTSLDTPRRTSRLTIGLAIALIVAILVAFWALRSRTDTAAAPPAADQTAQAATAGSGNTVQEQEDAIAMAPMPRATGDNLPQPEVPATTPSMTLPAATGSVGLVKAYSQTPEGAVAQLRAIDEAGMVNMSQGAARQVYADWFLPTHPDYYLNGWVVSKAEIQFQKANPNVADGAATATYAVSQGLVKGTADNGRFVVACILGKISYSYAGGQPKTIGGADCARMRWVDTRWMVDPVTPSDPPQTWPHSQSSYAAGFRDLVQGS